jgi:hypothetical protein
MGAGVKTASEGRTAVNDQVMGAGVSDSAAFSTCLVTVISTVVLMVEVVEMVVVGFSETLTAALPSQ